MVIVLAVAIVNQSQNSDPHLNPYLLAGENWEEKGQKS